MFESAKLDKAVQGREWDKVARLIAQGVKPQAKTLEYAVANLTLENIQMLLAAGAAPSARMIHIAILKRKFATAQALGAAGAIPDAATLDYAVRLQEAKHVKMLLALGATPRASLIDAAMDENNIETAQVLIEGGAIPDIERVTGTIAKRNTPWVKVMLKARGNLSGKLLGDVVRARTLDDVKYLISAGAFPDKKTMDHAVASRDAEWVDVLKKAQSAQTPDMLWDAIRNDHPRALALMEAGVVPNEKTLAYAIKNLSAEWLRKILKAGAQPTQEMLYNAVKRLDWWRATALAAYMTPDEKTLARAVARMSPAWTQMLLEAGGKPTTDMIRKAVCDDGSRSWLTAKALMTHGGEPDPETFDFAAKNLFGTWVEILLDGGAQGTPEMIHDAVCVEGQRDFAVAQQLTAHDVVPLPETLDYAVNNLSAEWVEMLLKGGAQPTPQMLYTVVSDDSHRNLDVAKLLLAYGAELNGNTLESAINKLPTASVEVLLDESGAVPTSKMLFNVVGVENSRNLQTAKLLIERGAMPDAATLQYAESKLGAEWRALLKSATGKPKNTPKPKNDHSKPAAAFKAVTKKQPVQDNAPEIILRRRVKPRIIIDL